jgi:hypothetical protein
LLAQVRIDYLWRVIGDWPEHAFLPSQENEMSKRPIGLDERTEPGVARDDHRVTDVPVGHNLVKLVGEAAVPGASQFLDGNIMSGLGHAIVAGGAVALLAGTSPLLAGIAAVVVRLDSYSSSVNGRSLWDVTTETLRTSRFMHREDEPVRHEPAHP